MNLSERDQAAIWHPLTQHQQTASPTPIVRGEGAYLIDEQGRCYLDLVSSWWVNLHGHSHPEIADAIYQQAKTLEHVIFAGFTHQPAVELAEVVLKMLPDCFSKIFYSDNGSTAVEVALKMAYQYWRNVGEVNRKRFIAFENGYHGDTFGAMSVGKQSGYFNHFSDLFFDVFLFPYPDTWLEDDTILQREQDALDAIENYLLAFSHEVAAIIIEPLVQGSSGMRMCRPRFLQALEKCVRHYNILIIYDEVMTGFGRTGDLFACLKTETIPDIICLSKGLTGGFLPLSMTACHEKIYQAFLGDNFKKALAHSHSFTAHPLGCAAALASMKLLMRSSTRDSITMIERVHAEILSYFLRRFPITKARYCGTIAAFEWPVPTEYGSNVSIKLRTVFLEKGLLIRPIGNVIYLLPPYCITEDELRNAYTLIEKILIKECQGINA